MATGQEDAIRAIVSCLHSAPAVDVASAISTEETLQMLSKWAGELELSLAQHTEVRNGLAADCNFLHKQFEDTLQSLGIKPDDLTAVTLNATVQKLAALVQNASHTWKAEVVEAEPDGAGDGGGGGGGAADADAADGAGAAAGGRTFTFPVQATGLLKLVLRNTAEQHRYAPAMMGFRAAGADVAVQVHRLYTREDGVEEKLKVSYKHSVGHSRWHRMLNSGLIGALFKADSEADAHNKSDSDASGTDSLHLSKRLKVEEAHTYLLNARPGDVFVCHVRPMPGSVAVEVSAEFIDMKLADALAQLHSAASVFSSHALAEIGTVVQKIAAVQQLAAQCHAFTDRVAKQEAQTSELEALIAQKRSEIDNVAELVKKDFEALAVDDAATFDEMVKEEEQAIRRRVQRTTQELIEEATKKFHRDVVEESTQNAADLQATRKARLDDERKKLEKSLQKQEGRQNLARQALTVVEGNVVSRKEELARQLADEEAKQRQVEEVQLSCARTRMRELSFNKTEAEVNKFLKTHHDKLEKAIRERRDAILRIRALGNEERVREVLKAWDYKGAFDKLSPYLGPC